MNIAVIGSRNIGELDLSKYITCNPSVVISGGAKGVDTLAENWAKKNGLKTVIFKPEYEKYGRCAPLRRNITIVDNCDILYAFWDGVSRGTKHTIDYAKKAGKIVKMHIIK